MKIQRRFHFPLPLFGIMPLLNVLFLVVVFFVLGSKFTFTPGVQVALPSTSFALGPQRNAEIVSLTAGPVVSIYHRERKVTFEELRAIFAANRAAEKWLILKADTKTPSGFVVSVSDEALRHNYSVILAGSLQK